MDNVLASKILNAAKTALSATALANAVGKSKGYMIQEELDYLIGNGSLEVNEDGRFPTYVAKAGRVTVRTASPAVVQNNVVEDGAPEKIKVPAGYTVSKKKFKKDKDGNKVEGRVITLPNGESKFVKTGYTLVAINNETYKAVKSPAALVKVISEYAADKGMTPYVVRASDGGTIGDPSNAALAGGVVSYTIEKTNKAA